MSIPLYEQIAESIRTAIYTGALAAGAELPTIRDMAQRWECAPGTVQRAYHLLTEEGLLTANTGRGTMVRADAQPSQAGALRQAELMNATEAFLLRMLSAGYTVEEFEQALALSLDRWRALQQQPAATTTARLRFAGSHDPAIARLAAKFREQYPTYELAVRFTGSLGGLIALAEHRAELAGCHLWDTEQQAYNAPFVRRFLPGQRVALLTLAHRRLGLIVAAGNPRNIQGLDDLGRSDVRFINRQTGAGTRVWLDAQLHGSPLSHDEIPGYVNSVSTHTEVAQAVATGEADAGLGIATVAMAYGLDFIQLTSERYDLVIVESVWQSDAVQGLRMVLQSDAMRSILQADGHDTHETGTVRWVE